MAGGVATAGMDTAGAVGLGCFGDFGCLVCLGGTGVSCDILFFETYEKNINIRQINKGDIIGIKTGFGEDKIL